MQKMLKKGLNLENVITVSKEIGDFGVCELQGRSYTNLLKGERNIL